MLAPQPQHGAAGDQQGQPGQAASSRASRGAAGCTCSRLSSTSRTWFPAQPLDQQVEDRRAALRPYAEGAPDDLQRQPRVGDRSQVDEPHPAADRLGDREGEPGLADAARADQRHQAYRRFVQQRDDRGDLAVPADDRGGRGRQRSRPQARPAPGARTARSAAPRGRRRAARPARPRPRSAGTRPGRRPGSGRAAPAAAAPGPRPTSRRSASAGPRPGRTRPPGRRSPRPARPSRSCASRCRRRRRSGPGRPGRARAAGGPGRAVSNITGVSRSRPIVSRTARRSSASSPSVEETNTRRRWSGVLIAGRSGAAARAPVTTRSGAARGSGGPPAAGPVRLGGRSAGCARGDDRSRPTSRTRRWRRR